MKFGVPTVGGFVRLSDGVPKTVFKQLSTVNLKEPDY
jgi:hypothetical protein